LLGDDRPDLLEAFYAREQTWLKSGPLRAPAL
jgi:hypothetical protein